MGHGQESQSKKQGEPTRREALESIAKVSRYLAPATLLLIAKKSEAFVPSV